MFLKKGKQDRQSRPHPEGQQSTGEDKREEEHVGGNNFN